MPAASWENRTLKASGQKLCNACKEIKPLDEFNIRNAYKGWYKHWCRGCEAAHFKEYYKEHGEELRASAREYHKTWKDKRFDEVLQALGNRCACCGEDNIVFLTVDHINNDGYKEKKNGRRSGRALWSRVRAEGFPKDKYRILCFNCNCGRARLANKICPHELKKETQDVQAG